MQNFLRKTSYARRFSRWGDFRSVYRAVISNFERLVGLPAMNLYVACPFWEAQSVRIINYAREEFTPFNYPVSPYGGLWELSSQGLVDTGSNTYGTYSGIDFDLRSDLQEYLFVAWGLRLSSGYDGPLFSLGSGTPGSSGGSGIEILDYAPGQVLHFYGKDSEGSTVSLGVAGTNLPKVNTIGYAVCGGAIGRSYQYVSMGDQWGYNERTGSLETSTKNTLFGFQRTNASATSGQIVGGLIVVKIDKVTSQKAKQYLPILINRGWEIFQPTSFTDYFIGPALEDVLITYDPNVDKDEDLTLDLTLLAQLFTTVAFHIDDNLKGESSLAAAGWIEYIHLSSLNSALSDIVFAGVFMEVLKSGILDSVVALVASGFIEASQLGGFESETSLTGSAGVIYTFNLSDFNAPSELIGDNWVEVIKDGTFSAGSDLSFSWNNSVLFNALALEGVASLDSVMVPEGSVFIDWIIGEARSTIGGNIVWGYVHQYSPVSALTELVATHHAEYSLTIENGILAVAAILVGQDQVVNLPTTGDLRKTDLISLKVNLDLITLRR